jgi:hypothetical protein
MWIRNYTCFQQEQKNIGPDFIKFSKNGVSFIQEIWWYHKMSVFLIMIERLVLNIAVLRAE